jgi:hypothetical protein
VDLWHRRLGHPSNASLSYLLSKVSIPCTNNSSAHSVCEACDKGNHIRLTFSDSKSITYFPFQIIHCDLWISPCESLTWWFSHYIWAFLIHLKPDVTDVFCDFYGYILNQFHFSIQSIQCDNGNAFDIRLLPSRSGLNQDRSLVLVVHKTSSKLKTCDLDYYIIY